MLINFYWLRLRGLHLPKNLSTATWTVTFPIKAIVFLLTTPLNFIGITRISRPSWTEAKPEFESVFGLNFAEEPIRLHSISELFAVKKAPQNWKWSSAQKFVYFFGKVGRLYLSLIGRRFQSQSKVQWARFFGLWRGFCVFWVLNLAFVRNPVVIHLLVEGARDFITSMRRRSNL